MTTDKSLDRRLFDLDGKVAVITGGGGIQGRRISRALAAFGADVAVLDINEKAAVAVAEGINDEYPIRAIALGCDVADPDAVRNAVEKVYREFSAIHILHNNAASKSLNPEEFFAPFEEYSIAVWRDIMSVNIDGMFYMAQAVGRIMVEQKSGSIIQTASIYGLVGPDQRIYDGSSYMNLKINTPAVYAASKAAVVGLTKYLATYWGKKNVRVNCLTPGGIESGQNDTFKEKYSNRVPLGRMAQVDEMLGAVIYLASDASSYVTGHNLVVDGGWTAW